MNAVVTGGSHGIGAAICLKLAAAGYNVALCARDPEDLENIASQIRLYDVTALAVAADLSVPDQTSQFLDTVAQSMGHVDVLVNNAGIYLPGPLMEEHAQNFDEQLAVNLHAAYAATRRIGRGMKERGRGHIFNIVSVAGMPNSENGGSYAVTKAAMLSLNNVTRQELAPYGVKVTAIVPGQTRTRSWDGTTLPDSAFVQPDDIAAMLISTLNLSEFANVEEIVIRPVHFKP